MRLCLVLLPQAGRGTPTFSSLPTENNPHRGPQSPAPQSADPPAAARPGSPGSLEPLPLLADLARIGRAYVWGSSAGGTGHPSLPPPHRAPAPSQQQALTPGSRLPRHRHRHRGSRLPRHPACRWGLISIIISHRSSLPKAWRPPCCRHPPIREAPPGGRRPRSRPPPPPRREPHF